jgi:hypothetical protein
MTVPVPADVGSSIAEGRQHRTLVHVEHPLGLARRRGESVLDPLVRHDQFAEAATGSADSTKCLVGRRIRPVE